MVGLNRRNFLKMVGLTGSAAIAGCSPDTTRKLIPYIIPPEDIVPGEATWYATTCRECPAGCGLLAKNRDGHMIKVEGNPLHPVNQGKLCARGQASLQGLYNPDRVRGPMKKTPQGKWEDISWEEGEKLLNEKISQVLSSKRGDRIVFLSDLVVGTLRDLIALWLSQLGSQSHLQYEPLSFDSLRKANQVVFGLDAIPRYRLERSTFLISFGADFLEAWLSDVEYARQFAAFRAPGEAGKAPFVYVGPRLSLTAANADQWVPVPPGSEFLVGLGMIRVILEGNLLPTLSPEQASLLRTAIDDWPLDQITAQTGVKIDAIRTLAARFVQSKRPLALAGTGETETAVAANLLCTLVSGTQELFDFQGFSALSEAAGGKDLKQLIERMEQREVDLLLLHNTNPVFSLPGGWNVEKAIKTVPFIVTFSSTLDETSRLAHLCLPTNTALESWGDYTPRKGIYGWMQPVMGLRLRTRQIGDVLLSSGRTLRDPRMFPWPDYYQMLRYTWELKGRRISPGTLPEAFWLEALQRGGVWAPEEKEKQRVSWRPSGFSFPRPDLFQKARPLHFLAYPTLQLYDGRGANRPWLQELPDPLTQVTWESWIEIHPETARKADIVEGDLLQVQSPRGNVEAKAFLYPGVHQDMLAMPVGRGHTAYGKFAEGQPGNPFQILSPHLDPVSGGILRSLSGLEIKNLKQTKGLAHTDGSRSQHGRQLARAALFTQYQTAKATGQKPILRLPLPEGYTRDDDIYKAHPHPEYRWIMVVDLDRCVGCGACVVACDAENNVPFVGKDQVLMGREMAWLRIERYFETEEPWVRFLPMMCQHCDAAPCEAVCPMFAPNHGTDGLNNQVYNRCIGTFFCSQNCPYKVRRFNWFTFPRHEPLNWQLNPDVTVRHKGVMEKCSFCIQRIVEAKNRARREARKVKDGEVVPACAQTCPTEALIFGNLVDPHSRVARLIQDPRAYQVLGDLNTKPGVIYLKKLTLNLEIT